jgi:hypothetical protein
MKDLFWIYNPMILFNKEHIKDIWPMSHMSYVEKINAITRLVIILTILGYLITNSIYTIISGLSALGLIIMYFKKHEGFQDMDELSNTNIWNSSESVPEELDNSVENKNEELTQPTTSNPMMNVMLTDIVDNPTRSHADLSFKKEVHSNLNNEVKKQILENNSDLDDRLFRDAGDEMDFEHSMRNFYTNPNTEIPNSQNDFINWCYGNMPSRKEGSDLEQN